MYTPHTRCRLSLLTFSFISNLFRECKLLLVSSTCHSWKAAHYVFLVNKKCESIRHTYILLFYYCRNGTCIHIFFAPFLVSLLKHFFFLGFSRGRLVWHGTHKTVLLFVEMGHLSTFFFAPFLVGLLKQFPFLFFLQRSGTSSVTGIISKDTVI